VAADFDAIVAAAPPVHHDVPWICAQRWEAGPVHELGVRWRWFRPLVPSASTSTSRRSGLRIGCSRSKMAKVHLRGLPGIPGPDGLPELNLRTYVRHDDEPGVLLHEPRRPSGLAVWIGQHVSMFATTTRTCRWTSTRAVMCASRATVSNGDAAFRASYRGTVRSEAAADGSLEQFLCERYAMYGVTADGSLVRGDIRHAPWRLRAAELDLDLDTVLASVGCSSTGRRTTLCTATPPTTWCGRCCASEPAVQGAGSALQLGEQARLVDALTGCRRANLSPARHGLCAPASSPLSRRARARRSWCSVVSATLPARAKELIAVRIASAPARGVAGLASTQPSHTAGLRFDLGEGVVRREGGRRCGREGGRRDVVPQGLDLGDASRAPGLREGRPAGGQALGLGQEPEGGRAGPPRSSSTRARKVSAPTTGVEVETGSDAPGRRARGQW